MKDPVLLNILSNGIATLTLNREAQHNIFDMKMLEAMIENLDALSKNPKVKILVLQANGKSFCAGADLNWMRKSISDSQIENERDATQFATMMYKLAHFNKPTVAIVQGPAYGGGIGLIAGCKIAIASTKALFCFSEVKLGIIPAVIGPYVIRAIGTRHALAYFLSAKLFDAQTACTMGLCQAVVSPDKLESTANEWLDAILQGGPFALQAVEHFIDECPSHFGSEIIEETAHMMATLRISPEGQEGINAFLEKRKPDWID